MSESRLYTIGTASPIEALGNIVGPLTVPTKIDHNSIVKMLKNGYVIYQHNPYDLTEKVRVTKMNINTIKFTKTRSAATAQRMLNRSVQNADKGIIVANLKKEDAVRPNQQVIVDNSGKKDDKNNNKHEEKKDAPKKDVQEKVTAPDGFTK